MLNLDLETVHVLYSGQLEITINKIKINPTAAGRWPGRGPQGAGRATDMARRRGVRHGRAAGRLGRHGVRWLLDEEGFGATVTVTVAGRRRGRSHPARARPPGPFISLAGWPVCMAGHRPSPGPNGWAGPDPPPGCLRVSRHQFYQVMEMAKYFKTNRHPSTNQEVQLRMTEILVKCTSTACSCIWWLIEMDLVNDFRRQYPMISHTIESADGLWRNQLSNAVGCLIQDQQLSPNMQSHDRLGDIAPSAIEIEPLSTAVRCSKYSPSSLMTVTSGIILLGTGYFAANYFGT